MLLDLVIAYSTAFTRRDFSVLGFLLIANVFQAGIVAFSIYAGVASGVCSLAL